MKVAYLIGAPGVGKSTALRSALEILEWGKPASRDLPVPHLDYGQGRIQVGRDRGNGFSGTDALALSINPRAVGWIATTPGSVVVGEGDRLANGKFLEACEAAGTLRLIWLDAPPTLCIGRMVARAADLGVAPQTAAWWKGRYTKTAGLAGRYTCDRVDATASPRLVAERVAALIAD